MHTNALYKILLLSLESKFPEDPKREERFINDLETETGYIWFNA